MIENISTLENSSSVLSVTLHENKLTNNGTYFATVSRNMATFKNILSEIAEDNKGIDPFMLQYAAVLIQKKILKMLEQGKAVNVLDLGTLYISLKCSARGKSDVAERGSFCIKFAPTGLANEAVAALSVDKVVFADASPEILSIEDISTGKTDGTFTPGKPMRITGSRLKLGGEGSGIFFVPVEPNGDAAADESAWTAVPETDIFRNMPSELNFFAPQILSAGSSWRLVLKTAYLSKTRSRKSAVEAAGGILKAV